MTLPISGPDPKVYVVSLARATERRKAMAKQLSSFGIDFVFVDAVDADQVGEEYLRSQIDAAAILRNLGRSVAGPEIACALSHRLAYRDIAENGFCGGLILEDDAIIQPDFPDALAYFRESGAKLSGTRAIYHLEAMSTIRRHLALRKRTAVQITRRLSLIERIDWASITDLWYAVGYYVTRAAAIGLLESRRIETLADNWSFLSRNAGARFFVSSPAVVFHPLDASVSDIQHARAEHLNAAKARERAGTVRHWIRWFCFGVRRRISRHVIIPIAERIL
jgi:glycosyl transferase family 25